MSKYEHDITTGIGTGINVPTVVGDGFGDYTWPTTPQVASISIDQEKELMLKIKLINAISEEEQCRLITEGEDIFKYILKPSKAVIAVHDGLNNL